MATIPDCPACKEPIETMRVTLTRSSGGYSYQVLTNCVVGIDGRTYHHRCKPMVAADELLRIGMSGGRNLVETAKPKARRDTVTLDLFDVQERLF